MLAIYVERGGMYRKHTGSLRTCRARPSMRQQVCTPHPRAAVGQSRVRVSLLTRPSAAPSCSSEKPETGDSECLHHKDVPVLHIRDFFPGQPFVKYLLAYVAWWCRQLGSFVDTSSFQRPSAGEEPSATPAAGFPVGGPLPSGPLQSWTSDALPACSPGGGGRVTLSALSPLSDHYANTQAAQTRAHFFTEG